LKGTPHDWWEYATAFPDDPTQLEDALQQFEIECAKLNYNLRNAKASTILTAIQPEGRELFHFPPLAVARIAAAIRDNTFLRFAIVTSSPNDWRAAIHAAREVETSENRKRDLTWWLNGGKPMNVQIVLAAESARMAYGLLDLLQEIPANQHRVWIANQPLRRAQDFGGRQHLSLPGLTEQETLLLYALERRWEADWQRCLMHEAETLGHPTYEHHKRMQREIELAEALEKMAGST
jgi:hypothetical protein